jgi:exosortase
MLSSRSPIWPVAGLVIAWIILITQVRHHWGGESYYNFGLFVPFLAIWLWLRNLIQLSPVVAANLRLHAPTCAIALLLVLPIHALSEVNPFWRLPLWIQAGGLCLFSLSVIHGIYGWKGVRSSIFPLFFLCTMIPWPYRFEVWIVQSLTEIVAEIAVDGLQFLGYPVQRLGNSLSLGEISIGVNEACSGIRSLQALFMVTLFLGSLFGQSVPRRVAAILLLPLIVIVVNSGRAIFLATQVIVHGQQAYESWHDPAGYIAFGISMLVIYACIELLNIGAAETPRAQDTQLLQIFAKWRTLSVNRLSPTFAALPVLLLIAVEGWFQYHEAIAPERREWTLNAPTDSPDYHALEINSQIESLLGYTYGERFIYSMGPQTGLEVYYYGYGEEDKLASVSSYGHSPAICMEAVGATMLDQFSDLTISVNEMEIPIQHFLFEGAEGKFRLHVFWVIWEHRNMDISPEDLAELNYRTQWVQLLKGRRDFSRQVLLASVIGTRDARSARELVSRLLGDWIQPTTD